MTARSTTTSNTTSLCDHSRRRAQFAGVEDHSILLREPLQRVARQCLPMHYMPRRKTLLDRAGSLVHTTFSLAGLRPARGHRTAA